jgi:hypothetical protein
MWYILRDPVLDFEFKILVESQEAETKLLKLIEQMKWEIKETE